MKRIIPLILIFIMILSSSAIAASEDVSCGISEYTNNEILVMHKDGSSKTVTFDTSEDFKEITDELSQDENVLLYQPNYSYSASSLSFSDTLIGKQWALSNDGTFYMEEQKNEFPVFDMPFGDAKLPGQWFFPDYFGFPGGGFRNSGSYYGAKNVTAQEGIDINLEEALKTYEDSGREIIVAMVDTGIDYTHEELKGRIWTNADEIADNGIDDDNNGYTDDVYGWNFYDNSNKVYNGSDDDHGTHGAGTIVAKSDNAEGIAGINQSDNIKVMSVKALGGKDGSGTTASVIKAIQYAEANGAQICNLSLGTSANDNAIYQTIANSNMLFVVAAGNDGANTDKAPCYPASYDLENIISVANLGCGGTLCYSSNYGANTVDIAAPGSYILSTTSGGGYSYMSGTSMSAPMVSAAAAMVYSHFKDITLADVKEILLASSKPLESLNGACSTGGMLNLGDALSYDLNNLSGNVWETKTPYEYKGTAPEIGAYITEGLKSSFLVLQVCDEENDLAYVSYCNGKQSADYFKNGNDEKEITLDEKGMAIFEPKAGTFTFYAIDAEGNETVRTLTITEKNRSRSAGFFMRGFFPQFP